MNSLDVFLPVNACSGMTPPIQLVRCVTRPLRSPENPPRRLIYIEPIELVPYIHFLRHGKTCAFRLFFSPSLVGIIGPHQTFTTLSVSLKSATFSFLDPPWCIHCPGPRHRRHGTPQVAGGLVWSFRTPPMILISPLATTLPSLSAVPRPEVRGKVFVPVAFNPFLVVCPPLDPAEWQLSRNPRFPLLGSCCLSPR